MHPRHAHEIGMHCGHTTEPHQSTHHRCVHQLGELPQFVGCARRDNAATRVHPRPLGVPDHLRRALDLAGVSFREDLVARQVNAGHRRVMPLRLKYVFRNVDQHRARAAAGCDVERFVHDLRQIRHILHHEIVLGTGARDAERVGFLERIAADELAGHLPGDGHDRNRIHQRIHQARDQVGRARAGRGAAHANFAGGARIAFGREAGVLFMAHQHVANVMVVHGVVERQRHASRVTEKAIHAFAHQAFQQHLRATHQIRHNLRLKKSACITKKAISRFLFPR